MPKVHVSRRGWWLLMAVLGFALLATPAARACPFCADALPNAHSNDDMLSRPGSQALQSPALAEGFYYSILLMVFVPYLVLGGLGFYFWHMYRVHARAMQADDAGGLPPTAEPEPA